MGSAPSGPIEAALHAAEHGDADKLRDAVEQLVAMLADNKAVASPTSNGAVLIAHSRTEATPAGVLRGLKCPQGRTLLQKLVSRRGGADGARGWLGGVAYVLQHVGADADFVNHKAAPGGSRAAAALFDMAGGTMHAVIRDDELDDAQQLVGVAALLLHGADATQRGGKHDRTPRQKHVHGSNYHRPVVAALLERAEAVGGDAAVRELLAECPSQLVAAPGYTVVSGLPAVRAAVRDAGAPAPAAVSFDELKSAEAACGLRGRQDVFRAAAHGDRAALEKALARCAGLWRRARQSALSEPAEHGINVLHSLCKHRAGGPGRDGWLGCIAYALSVLGAERAPVVLNARDQWGRTPLFYVAAGKRSAPAARVSESQQAVAAALLLVYGADASIRGRHADFGPDVAPADEHARGNEDEVLVAMLRRAQGTGTRGAAAVQAVLKGHDGAHLTGHASWGVVEPLPLMRATAAGAATAATVTSAAVAAAAAAPDPYRPVEMSPEEILHSPTHFGGGDGGGGHALAGVAGGAGAAVTATSPKGYATLDDE